MKIILDKYWQDFLNSLKDNEIDFEENNLSPIDFPNQVNIQGKNGVLFPDGLINLLKSQEINLSNNSIFFFRLDQIVGGDNLDYEFNLNELSENIFLSLKPYCFNFLLVAKDYTWVAHFRPNSIISIYGSESLIDNIRNLLDIEIV